MSLSYHMDFPENKRKQVECNSTLDLSRKIVWWSIWESNPRPLTCEASALPTELMPQINIAIIVCNRHSVKDASKVCLQKKGDFLLIYL